MQSGDETRDTLCHEGIDCCDPKDPLPSSPHGKVCDHMP